MAKKVYNTSKGSECFNGKPSVKVFRKENKDLVEITDDVVINTTIHFRDFVSFSELYAIFVVRKYNIFAKFELEEKDSWVFENILDKIAGVWNYSDPHFSDWWVDQLVDKLACNVYNVIWQRVLKTDGDKEAYKQAESAYTEVKSAFV